MAGNEWLNGYLEAILDAGAKGLAAAGGGRDDDGGAAVGAGSSLVPGLNFSPTKYFVEEVVNSSDEADLHKTWVKVIATRNSRERNNRLENICWRIWHLARKKKQIQLEGAKGLARRTSVREQGRHDASEDISELSEGEKGGGGGNDNNDDSVRGSRMQRMNSNAQMWLDEDEDTPRRLYIVLVSLHGLVRGENMELGRDSDTGGQVKYVVELARALAATKGIYRVDLLTRQILSSDVDWSYGEPVEMLTRPSDVDFAAETSGAYIIRLPCGPRDKYLAKESLWPHVPEFVDRALAHIMDVGRALGEQVESAGGKAVWPYVIHGHYADAGDVAARLSGALNVPMVLTGHSLGRNKFEQLLKQGRLSREEINSTYKIMRRIEAEEFALDAAEMVVTSTRQEIDEQWGLYDGFDLKLERKLRVRRKRGVSCLGRHMPRMVVIPPGMDFSYVKAQDHHDSDGDLASLISNERAQGRRKLPPIWSEVMRFFTNPHKPMILALSRPDPKKNVTTLIRAFGESRHLRELANMTLILGNRDDVEEMAAGPSGVLTTVLKLIDKYDLYGSVAYPKHHKQHEVPEIYRLAAKTKGVFINPALVEPFGLTLIEAAAYGLPVVATKNGGPVDIIKALNNGLLVDPHDHKAISEALLKLVADKSRWQDCRRNGLRNIHRFSWPEHCRNYLSHVDRCRSRHPSARLLLDAPQRDDPLSDSLKDLSLRFSVDDSADPAGATAALFDALRRSAPGATANGAHAQYSHGRRRRLAVVAVDCYGADGRLAGGELRSVVRRVAAAAGGGSGSTGLVVMTGATAEEAVEALGGGLLQVEVDALVCRGGSEIWFPWKDMGSADVEYWAHIEYRWPGDHVKSAVPRLAGVDGGAGGEEMLLLDAAASTSYCYAYSLAPEAKARKIDNLKHRFRMRGFRCKLVYTHACTRLNVMPLFASRAQALRYLSIIWGIDLSKMVMFVGDKGDSDHEELLLGLHNVVVLKGLVKNGSESLLREDDNYKTEDVFAQDSPNITYLEEGYADADMQSALESFGFRS